APALAKAATDADVKVRLQGRRALEDLADLQRRLLRRAAGVARTTGGSPVQPASYAPGGEDPLGEGLRQSVESLSVGISDRDVTARRAALETLEALGTAAAPAAPALIEALNNRDRFVRWSAARTLGRISP